MNDRFPDIVASAEPGLDQLKDQAQLYAAAASERLAEGRDKIRQYIVNEPAGPRDRAGGGSPSGMADQASVKDGKSHPRLFENGAPEQQVVGGIAGFGSDIATLAELQAQLAVTDLKESLQKALLPWVCSPPGSSVVIGALPVTLLGVAALLAPALKISSAGRCCSPAAWSSPWRSSSAPSRRRRSARASRASAARARSLSATWRGSGPCSSIAAGTLRGGATDQRVLPSVAQIRKVFWTVQ